jgi:hypothetical protein
LGQRSQYVQDAQIDVELDAFNQYQRLAGEAEARNVQTRRDFTPQQRREAAPWSTLDVPESELIVRRGGVGSRQSSAVGGIRSVNIPNAPEGRVMNAEPGGKLTFVETPDGQIQMYNPNREQWKDVTGSPIAENIKIKDAEINAAGGQAAYQANIDNIEARRKEVTVEQRAEANRLRDGLDYKMQHTAPKLDDNPPISNVEDVMPGVTKGDALRMYGTGSPYDAKALRVIQRMQGKPDADVTVYRAVPDGVEDINSSDWVTTTREYARDHIGNDKGYKILSKKVKAKDLAFDGNSIHEFGYDPRGDTVK